MSSIAAAKTAVREPVSATPASNRVRASLSLDFARDPASGCTVLASSLQEPPLRVVRAFLLADGSALAHLHNVSGGLLGGDCLALSVNARQRTSVQLTTTGATRIYRPRASAAETIQTNEISVAEDALLEYVPDPLIPFASSRYLQRTSIHLASGAGLLWWEIIAPGREARGEAFRYHRIELRTDIFANGHLIAAERARLEPESSALSSPARLGSYRYWATFYVCRIGLDSGRWLAAETHLREAAGQITDSGDTRWAISALVADGLVVRGLALRGRDIVVGLQHLWRAAKNHLWSREAILPRKVN